MKSWFQISLFLKKERNNISGERKIYITVFMLAGPHFRDNNLLTAHIHQLYQNGEKVKNVQMWSCFDGPCTTQIKQEKLIRLTYWQSNKQFFYNPPVPTINGFRLASDLYKTLSSRSYDSSCTVWGSKRMSFHGAYCKQ
jgi:hypothetical protein